MRSLVAVASLSIALLSGCVEDDASSMLVVGQVIPKVEGGGCAVSETLQLKGNLNFAVADDDDRRYQLFLMMNNLIMDDTDSLLNDPNIVKPVSFEVEITEFQGPKINFPGLPNPYTVPASGSVIDSRMGSNPGSGVFVGSGVPPTYHEVLEQLYDDELLETMVLRVLVNGETIGDNSVTADEWVWPVTLQSNSRVFNGDCASVDPGICYPGQDGAFTDYEKCK